MYHGYVQLLLDEGDSPFASRPKELDLWFQQLYEYYMEKGLACLLTCQVLNILTVAFTWFFSGQASPIRFATHSKQTMGCLFA
jgi:hypothetical protein